MLTMKNFNRNRDNFNCNIVWVLRYLMAIHTCRTICWSYDIRQNPMQI